MFSLWSFMTIIAGREIIAGRKIIAGREITVYGRGFLGGTVDIHLEFALYTLRSNFRVNESKRGGTSEI